MFEVLPGPAGAVERFDAAQIEIVRPGILRGFAFELRLLLGQELRVKSAHDLFGHRRLDGEF